MKMILKELTDGLTATRKTEVQFDLTCDVLVAGLGTAGAIAAICAAENGAKVIGVEKANMSGGTATAGGVFGYYYGLPGGKFEEIDANARAIQDKFFVGGGNFNPDTKGMELERQMLAAGVDVRYESAIIGAYLNERGDIAGVRMVTPEGVKNCACDVMIDATGEGEVCAMAGATFEHGRASDGQPQPFSSIRVYMEDNCERLGMANFDAGYAVVTDNADLTRAIIDGNSRHIDETRPLLGITIIPGPREGRLINCDVKLKFKDFLDGKTFGAPVALAYSNFDSHTQDWAFEDDPAKDWMVAASLWGKCFVFPLPLEATLVKGFGNLMAVGRCLSVDHLMACALRMQRCLQKLGEAAGIAAALATANHTPLRQVKHHEIVSRMKDYPLPANVQMPDCSWPEGTEKLKTLLNGEQPGEAIWTMAKNIAVHRNALLTYLGSSNKHLARNAALALGIAGEQAALSVLREIVREHDDFMPKSSRSHNQKRILGAIHLLGKLTDASAIPMLGELLNAGDTDFQAFSHALVALLAIGDTHAAERMNIVSLIVQAMDKPEFTSYRLLLKNSSSTGAEIFEPMDKLMRLIAANRIRAWNIDSSLNIGMKNVKLSWRENQLRERLNSNDSSN